MPLLIEPEYTNEWLSGLPILTILWQILKKYQIRDLKLILYQHYNAKLKESTVRIGWPESHSFVYSGSINKGIYSLYGYLRF